MRPHLALLTAALLMGACFTKPPAPPKEKLAAPARILQFYAASGAVDAGENVTICYGVEDAKSVRIEPPVEELKPALNPLKGSRFVLDTCTTDFVIHLNQTVFSFLGGVARARVRSSNPPL